MKFVAFLIRVLTGTQTVVNTLGKISAPTLAALMALFYDVMKFLITESSAVSQLANPTTAALGLNAILSENTRGLLANIATDYQSAKATVIDDMHQLGIATAPANISNVQK